MNKKYIKIRVLVIFWEAKMFLFLFLGLLAFCFPTQSLYFVTKRYEPSGLLFAKPWNSSPCSPFQPSSHLMLPGPGSLLQLGITFSSHHSCSTATDRLQHSLPLAYNSLSPSIASGPAQGSPAAQDKGYDFTTSPSSPARSSNCCKMNLTVTL